MSDSEELGKVVNGILKANNVKINDFVQNELHKIAGDFWAADLISKETADGVQVMGVSNYTLASKLMSACHPSLVQKPEDKFPKFIEVLKRYEPMEQLAAKMESEFEEARKTGGSTSSQPSAGASKSSTGASKSSASRPVTLDMKQLKDVKKELRPFNKGKWKELGEELGLDEAVLEQVKSDFEIKGVGECLTETIKHWLKMNYDDYETNPPTWSSLADAMEETGDRTLAKAIRENHP